MIGSQQSHSTHFNDNSSHNSRYFSLETTGNKLEISHIPRRLTITRLRKPNYCVMGDKLHPYYVQYVMKSKSVGSRMGTGIFFTHFWVYNMYINK